MSQTRCASTQVRECVLSGSATQTGRWTRTRYLPMFVLFGIVGKAIFARAAQDLSPASGPIAITCNDVSRKPKVYLRPKPSLTSIKAQLKTSCSDGSGSDADYDHTSFAKASRDEEQANERRAGRAHPEVGQCTEGMGSRTIARADSAWL